MNWNEMSKKELLALPQRKRNNVKGYNSILLVSTKKKHCSGYNFYAVIGINPDEMEVAGYMDDMSLINQSSKEIRIDCSMKGVFHLWISCGRNQEIKFEVGESLSSTAITVKESIG